MTSTQTKTLSIFAPAKINLYLHVIGRLDNGYHTLDSLVAFADIGDKVDICAPEVLGQDFKFQVSGPFAKRFSAKELDSSPSSSNLVVRVTWALAQAAQKTPNLYARLTKNLPLGSGLGGGSSDAAAMIWGLLQWWDLPPSTRYLPGLMARLGADIPVCLPCKSARIRGIGDILDPVPELPEVPIVLVYPGKPCSTGDVFMRFSGTFREPQPLPGRFENLDALVAFLKTTQNDLMDAACDVVPEIGNALHALDSQAGCKLARLTGSGSSCFGLFEHVHEAQNAAEVIAQENPDWWVQAGLLGSPERY